MACDEALAARVRGALAGVAGVVEKRMFGGVGFLLRGNMAVGIHRDGLIVRLDPADARSALVEPGVRVFDITGRPIKGWLLVAGTAVGGAGALQRWVQRAIAFAATLPAKG